MADQKHIRLELTEEQKAQVKAATGKDARANEERTRQGWTNMLEQLNKVLTARSWGFKTPGGL